MVTDLNELITEMSYSFNELEDYRTIFSKYKKRAVGIVGLSSNCKINEIYEIRKLNDAKKIFGDNSTISKLCETALKNGAHRIVALAVNNSLEGYKYGFSLLKDISEVSVLICDSENIDINLLLKSSVEVASQNKNERIGIVSGSSSNDRIEFAKKFNSERIIVVAQASINDETSGSCTLAAALAGIITGYDNIIIPFTNLKIKGCSPTLESLSQIDINNYINAGITTFEYENDQLKPIKVITSKTYNNCVLDEDYRNVNTILIVDYVMISLRNYLKSIFEGECNDNFVLNSIKTQAQILLKTFLDNDIISDFSICKIESDENNICNITIEFTPITLVNQLNITANIRV